MPEFSDPAAFQLRDRAAEKQHGFSLSASLLKAGQGGLLVGYRVHVTPGVKPEPAQMKDIIKCAGGEVSRDVYKLDRMDAWLDGWMSEFRGSQV